MTATMENLSRICGSIKSHAAAVEDIGSLGFELIKTARALRDNPPTQSEEAMKTLSMLDCPVCGKHTLEPFVKTETGEKFWYCKDCGALYADQNNTPVQKLSELCPECNKQITLNDGPGAGKHWKCRSCKLCLADKNGKPVPALECPSCGKMSFSRFESQQEPGIFFWGCTLCKHHSEDQ